MSEGGQKRGVGCGAMTGRQYLWHNGGVRLPKSGEGVPDTGGKEGTPFP